MDNDFLNDENSKVDFLEIPSGTPSEAAKFKQKDFVGGSGQQEGEPRRQKTSLAEAHKKILRFGTQKYVAGYDEIKGKSPPSGAVFLTEDKNQMIELVGTQHAHQLAKTNEALVAPMIRGINERLRKYLEATADNPGQRLIMIEGANAKNATTIQERIAQQDPMLKGLLKEHNITTEQEAITQFGEMGAMMLAAQREGIPIMSPEPSSEEIVTKQKAEGIAVEDIALIQAVVGLDAGFYRGKLKDEKKFTQEEVFYALQRACQLSGWQRERAEQIKAQLSGNLQSDQQVREAFIREILPLLNARMKENTSDFDLVNADYSWSFDPQDRETYDLLHSPASRVEVFRKMSNISGEYRDDYILDRIHESVEAGKSPFVVYGSGHTVKLEPALAALYNEDLHES